MLRSGVAPGARGPEDGKSVDLPATPPRGKVGASGASPSWQGCVRKFPQIATPEPSGVQEQTYHGLWWVRRRDGMDLTVGLPFRRLVPLSAAAVGAARATP